MDLNEMSDDGSCKGRKVSASIEVPKPSRIRKTSEEPTMTELMAAMVLTNLSCSPVFHNPLNAKGISPHSFDSSGVGSWSQENHHISPLHGSRYVAESGNKSVHEKVVVTEASGGAPQRSFTPEDPIETESSMILLHRSTPTPTKTTDNVAEKSNEISDQPQDLRVPKFNIEKRIPSHHSHLSPSHHEHEHLEAVMEHEEQITKSEHGPSIPVTIPMPLASQIALPYYFSPRFIQQPYVASLPTEFRLHVAGTPPNRTRSPDVGMSAPGCIDAKIHRHLHRAAPYHKISEDSSVPSPVAGNSPSTLSFGSAPTAYYPFPHSPIPVASLSFSPSHHSKYLPKTSIVQQRQHVHQSASPKMSSLSPKSVPLGRKVRGDGKKCRKVYGMENRDMWCTACRWKKACQRFPD